MTVSELVALAGEIEAQGLSVMVLASQRLRHGKRIPPPKRVDGSLAVRVIGGNELNWHVAVDVADAKDFAAHRTPAHTIPLRVVQPAEKMSPSMRRMCAVDDPPSDPWGDSRRSVP